MGFSGDNGSAPAHAAGARTAFAAVLGLSCMFGGIWLSDGQLLGTNGSEAGTLAMRVCTCVVYFAFFLIARRFSRRGNGDVRWLFGVAATAGMALFTVGALCILLVMPGLERGGATWMALGVLSLFMVKTIGAPVSVGLVCLFARLDGAMVVRACTLGMLGAFALYSLASQHQVSAALGAYGTVGAAGALLCISLLLAMLGFGGAPLGRGPEKPPVLAALSVPGVVKRPMAKVVTPGFVIILVFSAMMLGFLRNGFTGGDFHGDPVSFAALILLLVAAFAWRGLRIEHVFYGALLCTAVGILLAPSIAWALPGLEQVMCGLGTSLFEVVSWALVVWAARNSIETLEAAATMRLAATAGHLLGTLVVAAGVVLAAAPAEALFASEQLMVFVYMVLLVVLLKFPGLQAPFAGAGDVSEYSIGTAGAGDVVRPEQDAGDGSPVAGAGGGTASVGAVAGSQAALQAGGRADGAGDDRGCAHEAAGRGATSSAGVPVPFLPDSASSQPGQAPIDPVSAPCDTIARTYRLTAREREVLGLIAHGRNMPFMEQELVISRNTLKMHIRHIYTKLDVHSKQEIIDMVEALIAR
ncbi:LuxR C-terminal-related transcriptional regulator [uncultured Senegalimassilia sp.]|uniref:response regulator transcription factor n=1 Tax=uncultured Senegalimassilia sp. TaxID=1714350 RepID=UPI0025D0AB70|nr:LuxR C-terminal-related transcriptional regulator [uncultured Senegalimassilia sp.]